MTYDLRCFVAGRRVNNNVYDLHVSRELPDDCDAVILGEYYARVMILDGKNIRVQFSEDGKKNGYMAWDGGKLDKDDMRHWYTNLLK